MQIGYNDILIQNLYFNILGIKRDTKRDITKFLVIRNPLQSVCLQCVCVCQKKNNPCCQSSFKIKIFNFKHYLT